MSSTPRSTSTRPPADSPEGHPVRAGTVAPTGACTGTPAGPAVVPTTVRPTPHRYPDAAAAGAIPTNTALPLRAVTSTRAVPSAEDTGNQLVPEVRSMRLLVSA